MSTNTSDRAAPRRHDNDGLRKRCRHSRSQWAKCAHAWYFNYQWKGVHHRICLDRYVLTHHHRHIEGKIEAEREAAKLKIAIQEGRYACSCRRASR